MKCEFCGNQDKFYFAKKNNLIYCRKCIKYINPNIKTKLEYIPPNSYNYKINYSLTSNQIEASKFIINSITDGKDCAINAVCGAGKTEILFPFIKHCLMNKHKIGIAIPRKDVVIEIANRFKKVFNENKVIAVYGGNSSELNGDIIVFTTHQAYKFRKYFDYLVIDEVDAFPFFNNQILLNLINNAFIKNKIYLSATMPKEIIEDNNILKFNINRRYHNNDIPQPKIVKTRHIYKTLLKEIKSNSEELLLVFFPTIILLEKISKKVKFNVIKLHSKIKDKEEIIKEIKRQEKGIIFTTTILERGITFKKVKVIVYQSDHIIFDTKTLIQITGRVGRVYPNYSGEILFITNKVTKEQTNCIKEIKRSNEQ